MDEVLDLFVGLLQLTWTLFWWAVAIVSIVLVGRWILGLFI